MLASTASEALIGINARAGRRIFQPWEIRSYQPISWFEMLQFSARMFCWCGSALRHIRDDCVLGSMQVPGDEPIFALPAPLDDKAENSALTGLRQIELEFRKVGLEITADTIVEIIEALTDESKKKSFQWLIDQIGNIEALSEKELRGKIFLYIPAERAQFFPISSKPNIFGEAVAGAFPSAAVDIYEAGTCLALSRGGACVFYLMRILEIGLTALGRVFDVSLTHTNWAPAIGEIEAKIRGMRSEPKWKDLPDCKEQQEFYAQAASHFGILKDAWRNYTMHARGSYTEEQAERIFENVKGFMEKLAERLHE
jgi:hypothetical protein